MPEPRRDIAPLTDPDCHRFCAALHPGKPHDPYYLGMANTVLAALLDEPVEERMRLMGMRRAGHPYVPRSVCESDEDDWWRCATCGGYDTNAVHRPTFEPADYGRVRG